MVRVALASLFLLVLANAASAERREALVFGAQQYRTVRPLLHADNDAEAVKTTLEKLGFAVTLEEDRSLKRMRRALADFADDAAGADVALVFFSGHGVEIGGDNRLLPIDADATSLDALNASTLPLEEVRATVAATAKVGLIVLDACRSDPFGARVTSADSTTVADAGRGAKALMPAVVQAVHPGLGRVGRADNILFAFSAAPGETASDGSGANSPFTEALTEYLGTDGLEIRSVLTLVQQAVYDETRGKQLPYVESGLPRTFFAATARDALPERERLLLAMANVTPDLRQEVEKVAAEQNMPLAPLYGALIGADLANLSEADRTNKLGEAAAAFIKTRDELRQLASADPAVTRLRAQAEDSLALGAFGQARQLLAQAVAIDAQAGDALAGNLVKRRLSEAASHVAVAGVARTQLDYSAAITALEQAANLHQRIENEDVPDDSRHDRDRLLQDLGDLYRVIGNTADALGAFERMRQAAELRIAKAAASSGERDLSVARERIGDVKQAQGDLPGALAAYEAGLAIDERLAARDPGNNDRQHDLSLGKKRVGDVRQAQGDLAGALETYEAALIIAEHLAAYDTSNTEWQTDLSISQEKIGDVKEAQGDLAGALAAYAISLDISERLAARDPENAIWQRDWAISLERSGDVKQALGNLAGALAAYQASFKITNRLAVHDPGNADWQRDTAVSLNKIADMRQAQGDLAGALATYQRGLAIAERLALRDPGNTDWQRDLSISQQRIGDVKQAQHDLTGALESYEISLHINEQLASRDPGNAGWQHDLSISQTNVGDVKQTQGDLPGALAAYQASLDINSRLAASDPANAERQRYLSVAHSRIGEAKQAAGDLAGAVAADQASLDIAQRLAARDPSNAGWQRDLIVSHYRLAEIDSDARQHLEAALRIADTMQEHGTLAPADVFIPKMLREKLIKLPAAHE